MASAPELDPPPKKRPKARELPPLERLDSLLSAAKTRQLEREGCEYLVALSQFFPGRRRAIASTLGHQFSPQAVDALLALPPSLPGVVEGLCRTIARGITRSFEAPVHQSPQLIALLFRRSRARNFGDYLHRATAAFPHALERLDHDGVVTYRIALRAPQAATRDPRMREASTPAIGHPCAPAEVTRLGQEFQWLHQRLARLRHTELWINGWSLGHGSSNRQTPAIQVHLVRAFFHALATPQQVH
ncbi:MAG: hypothetical protein ACPG77_03815 [Nannocystaceae bacterium]